MARFLWDGEEVPDDKSTWIAAYFDRLSDSGSEYRKLALQEIRAAGIEARASLDLQALQATFREYDAARDTFDRLLKSVSTLFSGGAVVFNREHFIPSTDRDVAPERVGIPDQPATPEHRPTGDWQHAESCEGPRCCYGVVQKDL